MDYGSFGPLKGPSLKITNVILPGGFNHYMESDFTLPTEPEGTVTDL